MSESKLETKWSVYGKHAPVVRAACPRCHLTTEFYGKLALAPVFRHCGRIDEMPTETAATVERYKR